MRRPKLLPCPFCGASAGPLHAETITHLLGDYIEYRARIICINPICGGQVEAYHANERRAKMLTKQRWNRRKETDQCPKN